MNTDISKFDDLGYVVITDFLSTYDHWHINEECNRLMLFGTGSSATAQDGWIMNSPGNPCKLDGAFMKSPILRQLATNEKLLGVARDILKTDELDTYISKFFPMIPKTGFSVGWHQDNYYIHADKTALISADVFMNGATAERGCLRVIPRSHDKLHPHRNRIAPFRWMEVNEDEHEIIDIEHDEPFAVIFHPNLIHTCYPNTSDEYRYSVAWEYLRSDSVVRTHAFEESQDRIKV